MTNSQADRGVALTGRLAWLVEVANQITDEAGLEVTHDIEDLVAIAWVGLLDTPATEEPSRDRLLQRCRQNLLVWAWEQGGEDQPLPYATGLQPASSRQPVTLRSVEPR